MNSAAKHLLSAQRGMFSSASSCTMSQSSASSCMSSTQSVPGKYAASTSGLSSSIEGSENEQASLEKMHSQAITKAVSNALYSHVRLAPDYDRLIGRLIDCEKKQDIVNYNFPVNGVSIDGQPLNITKVLCELGDNIVCQLVHWMRHLPFYSDIPLPLHTKILTSRWHDVLLLTMAVHQASKEPPKLTDMEKADLKMKREDGGPSVANKKVTNLKDLALNSSGESISSNSSSSSPCSVLQDEQSNMSNSPPLIVGLDETNAQKEHNFEPSKICPDDTKGKNQAWGAHESLKFEDQMSQKHAPATSTTPQEGKLSDPPSPTPVRRFMLILQYNMDRLYRYMTHNLQKSITRTQLKSEYGVMMEKVTHIIELFRLFKLSKEEYVCLKVILMLSDGESKPFVTETSIDMFHCCHTLKGHALQLVQAIP